MCFDSHTMQNKRSTKETFFSFKKTFYINKRACNPPEAVTKNILNNVVLYFYFVFIQ